MGIATLGENAHLRTLGLAALLFGTVLAIRALGDPASATFVLFLVPIVLCAVVYGLRGGIAAALLSIGLVLGWELVFDQSEQVGSFGYVTHVTAYLLVGALVGWFADRQRATESRFRRHYELAHDLICVADFDGYFKEVSPSWEETLGYSLDELRGQRFIEFVHPDDRARTEAETSNIGELAESTLHFRNRYLTADGGYRWLEWLSQPVRSEGRIYATARDITIQKEAEDARREAEVALQRQNDLLEQRVYERTRDLAAARLENLERLAVVAEYRDDDTHQHTERVGRMAALTGHEIGLSGQAVSLLRRAAPLHDIGKVGIPDDILLKPGKLTEAEFETIKSHTEIGARILAGSQYAVLKLAHTIALTHHERWDGGGYPQGLSGYEIPVVGRIVAVADAFDAMTHDRPYASARPALEARAEIKRASGSQFDPRIVEAFVTLDHARLLDDTEITDIDLTSPPVTSIPMEFAQS